MLAKIFEEIDKLNLTEKADFIYCHCSLRGLGLSIAESYELVEMLIERYTKKNTLIVPSFIFGTNAEYAKLLSSGIEFCVETSVAKVNLFGEIFRRSENSVRSAHPIFGVCANGAKAEWLTKDDHFETEFLGSRMAIGKLTKEKTYVLGLGVKCGTNSFAHFLDMPFENLFPVEKSAETYAKVLDTNGNIITEGKYYTISPELRKIINPESFHEIIKNQDFYTFNYNDSFNLYTLNLQPFIEFGINYAKDQYEQGKRPIWWNRFQ